jgi:hypothetical protein
MSTTASRSKSHRRRILAPAAGTLLLYDTFTGDDDTSLDAHTPDTDRAGNGWVEQLPSDSASPTYQSAWVLATNKVKQTNNTPAIYPATVDTGQANVTIVDTCCTSGVSNNSPGTALRWTDRLNFWYVQLYLYSHIVRLVEVNNGVHTQRASAASSCTNNNTYVLTTVANGASISASRDGGLEAVSYDSATHSQTATKHGLVTYRAREDSHDTIQVTSL